jgi:hypothetical protein
LNLPLRVSRDRIVVYGAAVFLAGLWQLLNNTLRDRNMGDWALFWTGGATVGTGALLDPRAHLAFERAHGFAGGIWPYVPAAAGAAIFLACLPRLVKLELVDALSVTSVVAVATSLHAWHYEPVIMLPAIFYALRAVSQPAITWLVVAAYVVADVSIFEIPGLSWNVLIVLVLFWTALTMTTPAGMTPLASSRKA